MEKQTSITKFEINQEIFYVKVSWKPNENDLFHLILFGSDKTWSGHYSYEFAKKYRDRLDETVEEYYDNVQKGLSNHPDFQYTLILQSDDNSSATFSWKKKFNDSVHGLGYLVYGSVPMHCDKSNESRDSLIDLLLAENQDLRNTINTLNANNEELTVDLNKCKEDLVNFVDIKSTLETSLYGKFVQLLNAKKKRIQLLEDSITKMSRQNKDSIMEELD